jgi:putative transposase
MADLSLISDADWREAERRAAVIRPLTEFERRPRHLILTAAAALGLAERQTYTLVRRCMDAGGDLTALLPGRSSGGRARPRVATAGEVVLYQTVHQLYLKPQKPTAAHLAREVAGRCAVEKVPVRPPSPSTIRRRLKALSIADMRRRGEEHPEAKPVHGHAPHGKHPLDLCRSTTRPWT